MPEVTEIDLIGVPREHCNFSLDEGLQVPHKATARVQKSLPCNKNADPVQFINSVCISSITARPLGYEPNSSLPSRHGVKKEVAGSSFCHRITSYAARAFQMHLSYAPPSTAILASAKHFPQGCTKPVRKSLPCNSPHGAPDLIHRGLSYLMRVPVSTSNPHFIRQVETEYQASTRKQPAEIEVREPLEKPELRAATIDYDLPLIRW